MKDTVSSLEKMYQQLSVIHPVEEAAWEDFRSIWTTVSYKRKEVVTAAGEVERYLYWVIDGVQRGFHLHDQKEATVVFTYPGSFSGIIDSFFIAAAIQVFLETLTSSHFLRASYQQVETCRLQHPSIAELMYKALAFTTSGILERQIELMVYSAEEKFRTLLKRSPHILQLVPHKYLASYLGIDATTFSKLLGTVRLG